VIVPGRDIWDKLFVYLLTRCYWFPAGGGRRAGHRAVEGAGSLRTRFRGAHRRHHPPQVRLRLRVRVWVNVGAWG